jgi:hypothetical protein
VTTTWPAGHDPLLLLCLPSRRWSRPGSAGRPPAFPRACRKKTRYRLPAEASAIVALKARRAQVVLEEPKRTITPGQVVVSCGTPWKFLSLCGNRVKGRAGLSCVS